MSDANVDVLSEEHQKQLHEENLERLMPKPITSPPGERQTFVGHGIESYKLVPGSRHYCVDLGAASELGAVASAYAETLREKHKGFVRSEFAREVLAPLAAILPELRQDRPGEEEPLPKMPVDPVTGTPIKNPWAKDSLDLDEQMAIAKRDPRLAEYLQAVKDGPRYSALMKLEDARGRREKIRTLEYRHRENPFLLQGKEGLAAQSTFARQHQAEPWLVDFYRREAQTPVTMSFDNLTTKMAITKRNPVLGAIYERAAKLHARWLREDVEKLKSLIGENTAEVQRAEKQLASAK